MLSKHALVTVGLLTLASPPVAAQDQYGAVVGVSGDRVLVLKPSAGQGPATVFSYNKNATGMWVVESRLLPEDAQNTGQSYSASLAVSGDHVLVGAGDPAVALGAHPFRSGTDGQWVALQRLALESNRSAGPGATQLDLAGLMRILQPAMRTVALDGDVAAVGVIGGTAETNGVTVAQRSGESGAWNVLARLRPVDMAANARFGSALAISGDRLAVGAPGFGTHGAVITYRRDGSSGEWVEESRFVPDTTHTVSSFGSALVLGTDYLAVGAPGGREVPGAVIVLQWNGAGGLQLAGRVVPEDGQPGDRFGQSVFQQGGDLWVGAPGASDGGKVHQVVSRSGRWVFSDVLTGPEPGLGFGTSVAASSRLLVVGAPGANGGRGSAAIYERIANAWSTPQWVSLHNEFDAVAGEIRCQDGEAAGFECGNVDLLAFLPISAIGGDPTERVSDMWGWTDPDSRREYALVARTAGVAFVDVTQPSQPRYLGLLPGNRSGARDIKVYSDHLFFTGDGAGAHGLLVFDLKNLRSVTSPPVVFEPDARYDGIASAHNLVIDTQAGFAYPVGASGGGETCGGGLHMVDIREPKNPVFAGCYTDTEGLIWAGRTHDAQCVVYEGPDENYRGREICFASNETALRIVDVTEKDNPVPVAAATYPGLSYVHQGWLTEDQRYFYLDDELDELVGQADRTRTIIWDVAELDDPVLVGQYFGPNGATDHNLYVKGDRMYQANYQAGMRVVDISDPENPFEIGFFDTTPYDGNPPGFNGAWTVYPFFESGNVIVTSMNEGVFVLRPRRTELVPDFDE